VQPAAASILRSNLANYVLLRGLLAGTGFFAVMAACRVPRSFASFALIAVVPLLAAAVATPVFALAAATRRATVFDVLFRLGIVPMSLVSGIYFPIGKMPLALQWLAWALPLSHGVDLVRMCTLGGVQAGSTAIDTAVLAAWAVGGFLLARLAFKRRLSD
jgi:lipooligosaccharide transport system permease protein